MMNQETYDYVLEILSREPSFNEGIRQLQKRWPSVFESVSEKTLKSIQAQYYVRRMRRNHYHHYSRETREKYYKLYKDAKSKNEKNVILRLAAKNDISSCLLARIILEEYYWNDVDHGRVRERGDSRGSLPPGFMTDCIRDIACLPNPELAREIYETIVLDNFYGPAVDSIKKSCGVEYEMILKARCRKAGFSFIDEGQMRKEGYDKTPDIKLRIPVMINCRVVNWIESKASFGDPINHQQYMIDQYLPYKNRFGPGAVVYWFGFVQELAETGERGILLLSKFPEAEQITHLSDVHKKEKDSVGFHLLSQFDTNEMDDNNCGAVGNAVEGRQFYNFVDPIFDSDEESNMANLCSETFKMSYSSSGTNEADLEKNYNHESTEYICSLENAFTTMSVDDMHASQSINMAKCDSMACLRCENVISAPNNNIDPELNHLCNEDICCVSNIFENAVDIDCENSPGLGNNGD